MCGRTACTLDRDHVQQACTYRQHGRYVLPQWRNGDSGYEPSYNLAPTNYSPVVVSAASGDRELCSMRWGLIPSWHKGDLSSASFSTINCRIEGLMDSKMYKIPFNKGQRCVVVCEGFYEWKKEKSGKQGYFVYFPQPEGVLIEDSESWKDKKELWTERNGWMGPRVLTMAGIYNVWKSGDGEEIGTYTVLTREASKSLSWLHTRSPVVLETEEAIQSWLDAGVAPSEALDRLPSSFVLSSHPVSPLVNNVRNKDAACNKPVKLGEVGSAKSGSSKLMTAWLQSGKKKEVGDNKVQVKREAADDIDEKESKKVKKENGRESE